MASPTRSSEAGFTLAGLIVIMTVISIMIAFTIPRQWSLAVARDHDLQTYFAMRQYARAMRAFQDKNKVQPVSLDQLEKARNPRFLRGRGGMVDALTGKMDWIPIPFTAQAATSTGVNPAVDQLLGGGRSGVAPPPVTTVPINATDTAKPGGFSGPMMGVRPNKTGKSYLRVNGAESYDQWSYTTQDLDAEINNRRNALMIK